MHPLRCSEPADASYIEQLGLSFVALRLNVTPETVDAQHQQLLRYVLPASQNSLKVHLAEDAKRIKDNNVNSTFYMTSMRAGRQRTAWISGVS